MSKGFSRRIIARAIARELLAQPQNRAKLVKSLAAYLVEYNRASEIEIIINDITDEIFRQSGNLSVQVTSAKKLSDRVRTSLKHTLAQQTGAKHVQLSEHTDPDLIGGLIARTPTATLDASVRTKLNRLNAIT